MCDLPSPQTPIATRHGHEKQKSAQQNFRSLAIALVYGVGLYLTAQLTRLGICLAAASAVKQAGGLEDHSKPVESCVRPRNC